MHFMHVRCHHDPPYPPIEPCQELDIGVFELRIQAGQREVQDHYPERDAKEQNRRPLLQDAPHGLSGMLSQDRTLRRGQSKEPLAHAWMEPLGCGARDDRGSCSDGRETCRQPQNAAANGPFGERGVAQHQRSLLWWL